MSKTSIAKTFAPENIAKEVEEVETGIKKFDELLTSIDSIEDKKKSLWKEIYRNAITDRYNSYILFYQLLNIVKDDAAQHAIHGATLNKYIERMNKSTDQLIKLAELVSNAQAAAEGPIDVDNIYSQIEKSRK